MLAVAAQRAFSMSLLELATADEFDGAEPPLAEVLAAPWPLSPSCPAAYPRRAGA